MTKETGHPSFLPHPPQFWREIIILSGIVLAYFIVARLGLLFVSRPENIAAFWPVSGLALSILLLRQRQHWPTTLAAIYLANTLANLSGGNSLPVSLGFALANSLEAATGAWLLRACYPRPLTFKRPADIVALLLAALSSTSLAGLLGAAVAALAFGAPYFTTWLLWMVSDGLSMLLLVPVIMTWSIRSNWIHLPSRRVLEAVIIAMMVMGSTWLIFGPMTIAEDAVVLPYLLYPLLVWAALRFNPRGVSSILLLMAVIASWNTVLNTGAFAFVQQTLAQHLLTLQLYLGITIMTIMILNAVVIEHAATLLAMQHKTEELDNFFNVNLDLLCIADIQGFFRRLNPEWEKTLGYPLEELIGHRFFDFIHPDDLAATQAAVANLSAQRPVLDFVNRYRGHDGSWHWLEWRSRPVGDVIYAAARDITERQQAEARLHESEALLKRSQVIAHVGHWTWNTQTNQVAWSDEMCHIFGLDPATITGDLTQIIATAIHPDDRDKVNRSNEAVLTEQRPAPLEYRVIWPDGSVRTVWADPSDALKDENGQIIELMGIVQDITERKRAEEKIRQSEEQYRRLIQSLPVGVIVYQRGQVVLANRTGARILGADSPEQLVGVALRDLVHPDYRGVLQMQAGTSLQDGAAAELIEEKLLRMDGSPIYAEVAALPVTFGDQPSVLAVFNDVTARWQAQAQKAAALTALRESERRLKKAQEIAHVGDWELELQSKAIFASEEAFRIYGIERISPKLPLDLVQGCVIPADRPRLDAALQRIVMQSGAYDEEFCIHRIDNSELRYIHSRAELIMDQAGNPARVLGSIQDVTASRQIETALRDSELRYRSLAESLEVQVAARTQELAEANARLTELDHLKSKFVSDVSHELRTPIANLKLYIDLLERGKPDKHAQYLNVLHQQVRRVAALVDDILDLSRLERRKEQGIIYRAVALDEVVDQVVLAHQPRAEADGLLLTFEPTSSLPPVRADANQLAQVVTNLVANALSYTSAGYVRVSTYVQDDQVCLSVVDSGSGIAPDDLPHVFERFYRGQHVLKNDVPGTGLGLAIVKEIVDLHEGRIEVDSQPGHGTTFRVWWPVAQPG